METLNLPFNCNGVLINIPVELSDGKLQTARLGKLLKAKPPAASLSVGEIAPWLLGIIKPKAPELLKHLLDHLVPLIETNSVGLVAAREKEKLASQKPAVLDSDAKPLDGTDKFRKDFSIGHRRLAPAAIDHSVKVGHVDVFVKAGPTMWGEEEGFEHVLIPITAEGYKEKVLSDLKRSNVEVLTGPDLVERGESLPDAMRRDIVKGYQFDYVGANGKVKTIKVPDHPRILPWELAIMKGTTHAEDVELPGSPHHKQRPFWIDF